MVVLDDVEYLSGEDVEPESVLKFVDEGSYNEIIRDNESEPERVFEIKVELPNGELRLWTMNATSRKAVIKAYGRDTKNWVGKRVRVYTVDQVVFGTKRKIIYARTPTDDMVEEPVEEQTVSPEAA